MRGNRQVRRLLQASLDAPRRAASPDPRAGGEWLAGVDKVRINTQMQPYHKTDASPHCVL